MQKKLFIGIGGGTASGKSAIAKYLLNYFGKDNCAIIKVDSYYHDLKHMPMEEREKQNFDNPNAIDFNSLIKDINLLAKNKMIHVPVYDYKTHTRTNSFEKIESQEIIIIEGLFSLYNDIIKSYLNVKIFVDTLESTRLERRIKRDLQKRERTHDSILKQFNTMVIPMHNKYVEPTKLYADLIIEKGVKNTVAINELIHKITYVRNNLNI
tara:strand:+ start:703 stop:1332 length:630 start_codon:yes stop_codon:yes gene_type:complete